MNYPPSTQSNPGSIAAYAKRIVQNGRPDMEIILDNHDEGKRYTTFDALSGRVEITAAQNARFDELHITLEGSAKVWVENLSPHSTRARTTAKHNFLKLTMPITEDCYPQPRVAEAGRKYSFAFNFVIPEHLLPRACNHKDTPDHVYFQHTRLLPSMGDREATVRDDLTPSMAQVVYGIKVKVIRYGERDGAKEMLTEGFRKIHVVPAIMEAPPMSIADVDKDYRLARMKVLRKGVFSGKLGKIHVSAAQPSAVILPSPSSEGITPLATKTAVMLRFDPNDKSAEPPRLGGLVTKIKATTFYACRAAKDFPTHFSTASQFETSRGAYDTSVNLSSRCVESVAWTKHRAAPDYTRRCSASSVSSSDYSDASHDSSPKEGGVYYSAEILVPITLPANKTWVPTFHSCIVSRVYTIEMSLTIHTPGAGVPATIVNLRLPLQIAADGNMLERALMSADEAAAELADVDAYLRPRIIETLSPELIGNSSLMLDEEDLPPSYEAFLSGQQAQHALPVRVL